VFPTLEQAKARRAEMLVENQRGRLSPSPRLTLREAFQAWHEAATASTPTVLTRSGHPYKPSVLRGYESDMRLHVLPELGALRLGEVRRRDVQALVDRLLGPGFSASKVQNCVMPLRALYRHQIQRDEITVNPTTNLRLPADHSRRDRVASATEAAALLAALPEDDRALWATAMYGGLRLGELRALRWSDVDLAGGLIRLSRSWDAKEGPVEPKSRKGTRTVPLTPALRDLLAERKAATGREGEQFVFGVHADAPFTPSHIRKRAKTAWEAANVERAKRQQDPLVPIGFHECRHSYVSLMVDAGFSLERVGDYVGHASTYMSERYRHLLDGHEAEAARLFDEYLARADTAGRVAQVEAAA
jgi:integrase